MKKVSQICSDLDKFEKRLERNLINAQNKTAIKIKEDVINKFNISKGKYVSSIKKDDTKNEGGTIKTSIYTDLKSKDGYLVGRMIENGTGIYALEPHIGHTKTFFESQFQYWYVPANDVDRPIGKAIMINGQEFYVAKAQRPKPHWKPALDMNKETYKENIRQAIKESK